jgi:hypothetical protein
MGDVGLLASEKIIDANHIMLFGHQPIAQMRA